MARRMRLMMAIGVWAGFVGVGALAAQGDVPDLPVGRSLGTTATQMPPAMTAPPLIPQISIGANPVLGDATAPVTIVEFIDYQCPFCQGFAKETYPKLKANYIDTGKVRYVARDFPLPKHEHARPAAIAAACAREQGRFWEMHDALLTAGVTLTEEVITGEGRKLGLDPLKFEACRSDALQGKRLDTDFKAGREFGVNGTPSFLVGASAGDIAKGRLLQGDEDYAEFEKVLAGYLAPKEN